MSGGDAIPREASTLSFKIRSCAVRSDLKNKVFQQIALLSKIRSYSVRSALNDKRTRFFGLYGQTILWTSGRS